MDFVIEDESGSFGSDDSGAWKSSPTAQRGPSGTGQPASSNPYDFDIEDESADSPPAQKGRQQAPLPERQPERQPAAPVASTTGRAARTASKHDASVLLNAARDPPATAARVCVSSCVRRAPALSSPNVCRFSLQRTRR